MSEVLMTYAETVTDPDGTFVARAIGRRAPDGMWEGWLEFIPVGLHGSEAAAQVIVGPVESRQPEREHLVYWSTGLTPVFLEGALHRARKPITVRGAHGGSVHCRRHPRLDGGGRGACRTSPSRFSTRSRSVRAISTSFDRS